MNRSSGWRCQKGWYPFTVYLDDGAKLLTSSVNFRYSTQVRATAALETQPFRPFQLLRGTIVCEIQGKPTENQYKPLEPRRLRYKNVMRKGARHERKAT